MSIELHPAADRDLGEAAAFWWSNTIDATLAMAVHVSDLTFPS
jgi:hypothetical protein